LLEAMEDVGGRFSVEEVEQYLREHCSETKNSGLKKVWLKQSNRLMKWCARVHSSVKKLPHRLKYKKTKLKYERFLTDEDKMYVFYSNRRGCHGGGN